MKRRRTIHKKKLQKPDAILMADIHLRETAPICRIDDYLKAQARKLKFICGLQEEYSCPILDAGDLFNRWKPSPFLLSYAIENLPENIYSVPGNHDIPQHNLNLLNKSGFWTLMTAKKIMWPLHETRVKYFELISAAWGADPNIELEGMGKKVLLYHVMTWKGKEPYPGAKQDGREAQRLLKQLKQFDLVVTGHNHIPFVVENEGRILVNPGSMMRMTTNQIDHKPCVYLWYAEENRVEPVYLPIEKDVISTDHTVIKKERDERMNAFVNRLRKGVEIGLSFESNLASYMKKNKISEGIEEKVWEAIEE